MRNLFLLFILSVCLNSCFSYTEDIIDHNDGSYTLRKSITLGETAMLEFASLQTIFDTVHLAIDTPVVRRAVMDSLRIQMTADANILSRIPGFVSYQVRDTVIDTNCSVITELRMSNIMSLPEFHRVTWGSKKQENMPDSKQLDLKIRRKAGKTYIAFIPPPDNKKKEKQDKQSLEMAKKIAESVRISLRVYSSRLDVQKKGSLITPIDGGQEWRVNIMDMFKNPKKLAKGVEFILKD